MKKSIFGLVLGIFLVNQPASARHLGPLLKKSVYPDAFGPTDMVREKVECEIGIDNVKITVTRFKDGQQIGLHTETKEFDGDGVFTLLNEAAKGMVKSYPGPNDSPTYTYQAMIIQPACGVKEITLLEYHGAMTYVKNNSPAAEKLIEILDEQCTYTQP